jgi:uncharacterized protein (TIGR03546 family)
MLLIIKFAAKILSILNGEVSSRQIAAGVALGVWIGLIPFGFLPTLLLFLALIVNVNLAMLFVASAIFKLVGFLFDPIANQLGFALLAKTPALKPLWTSLYNLPVVPYTRFNNTIVLGGLVSGLLLFIPVYLLARAGVEGYRSRYRDKIRNSRFMKTLQASTFYKYYVTFRDIRGG